MKTFDLKTVYYKDRPLSYSAIASFHWNKGQWYSSYVLKEPRRTSPEMDFGSMIDKKIQNDPKFLPKLERYPIMQFKMTATFDGIPLIGYGDHFDQDKLRLKDDKTGRDPWSQARADGKSSHKWEQFDMYLFMLYLTHKIRPEDVDLQVDWIPTQLEDGKVSLVKKGLFHSFKTKRNMTQVLQYGQKIKDTWVAMEAYAARQVDVVPHVKVKRPVSKFLK